MADLKAPGNQSTSLDVPPAPAVTPTAVEQAPVSQDQPLAPIDKPDPLADTTLAPPSVSSILSPAPHKEDDIGAKYSVGKQQQTVTQGSSDFKSWMSSQDNAQPNAADKQEADPTDPLGISLTSVFDKLGLTDSQNGIPFNSKAGAVAKDIGRGSTEIVPQVIGGAADAVNNTLKALDGVGNWLNNNVADLRIPVEKGSFLDSSTPDGGNATPKLPTTDKAKSETGSIIRGVSTFLTGFIPLLRGVRAATGGALAVRTLGGFAQTEAAAAAASGLVFDPQEQRLSNLVQSVPSLQNPVTDFLQAKPGDSDAEGRFKNALEGLGIGTITQGFMEGVGAIRANRLAQGIEPAADIPVVQDAIPSKLGDPKAPFIPKEAVAEYQAGNITSDNLMKYVNFSQLDSPEAMSKAIDRFAKLKKGETNDLLDKGQLPNIGRSGVTVGDDEVKSLASDLGIGAQDLLGAQRFLRGNKAIDAERIVSMHGLLNAASDKVTELAKIASNSTDNADMFDFVRMMNMHSAIQQYFKGYSSEAGRALRALQIAPGSRASQIASLQETLMNAGGPDKIQRVAKALSGINDPELLNKAIADTTGQKISNAVSQVWYYNLLSGPQTHIVNMLGNALNTAWQLPVRALAAQYANLRGSTNSVAVGEASHMFYGMVGSITDAFRAAGRTLVTGEQQDFIPSISGAKNQTAISGQSMGIINKNFSDLQTTGDLVNYVIGKGMDGLGAFFNYTSARPLMAEDEFFRSIGKGMQMNALAFRTAASEGLEGPEMAQRIQDILRNPPENITDSALDFSRSTTFSQPLGRFGTSVQMAANQYGPTKLILPFIKTPVNIFKWAGESTPLGYLSQSIRSDIQGGGAASDLALAKMSMGSLLATTIMGKVWDGVVTGYGPTDPGLHSTWSREKQPFSVKVGDTWYSYNRTDPFGLLMGAVATYTEIAGQDDVDSTEKYAAAIVTAVSKSMFNKSFMKGPANFLDATQEPDRYGQKWVEQMMGTLLVPSSEAQVARTIDPVWRDVQTIGDAILARTPGFSKSLPARLNLWGEPIITQGSLGDRMFNPVYHMQQQDRPIDKVMMDKQIPTDMPTRSQMGVQLTPQEYHDFTEDAGKRSFSVLNNMAQAGTFTNLSPGKDGMASYIIRKQVQDDRQIAIAHMMASNPSFRDRVTQATRTKAQALAAPDTVATAPGGQ